MFSEQLKRLSLRILLQNICKVSVGGLSKLLPYTNTICTQSLLPLSFSHSPLLLCYPPLSPTLSLSLVSPPTLPLVLSHPLPPPPPPPPPPLYLCPPLSLPLSLSLSLSPS